jgi:hypothetical protein
MDRFKFEEEEEEFPLAQSHKWYILIQSTTTATTLRINHLKLNTNLNIL